MWTMWAVMASHHTHTEMIFLEHPRQPMGHTGAVLVTLAARAGTAHC